MVRFSFSLLRSGCISRLAHGRGGIPWGEGEVQPVYSL